MRRPGIRVSNKPGLQNIITKAQVLKCPCVRAFDPGLQVSVGASDAAEIIRLLK